MTVSTRLKTLISACAVAAVMAPVPALSAETLLDALAAAYANNPQLQAQRAALRGTDEGVRQAKSAFFPTASGSYTRTEGQQRNLQFINGDQVTTDFQGNPLTEDQLGFQERPQESYGLQVDQSLFRGLRTVNEVRQAKAQVQAGRAQLQQIEQNILLDAATNYMNVVRDVAVTELNENNVQVLERQLQASQDRFRVGEVTRTDVAQSEARLEGAKAQLLTAQAQLAASRAAYERAIGRSAGTLEPADTPNSLPADLQGAVDLAIDESPNVALARYNEEAARRAIHVAEGALLPTVSLRGQLSRFEGTNFFGTIQQDNQITTRQVTLNVNVPIYTGGQLQSQVRQAKQVRSQRMLQIRQAENEAREQVVSAFNRYRAAKAQIVSQNAAVRANEIALDGVRQEAQVGSRTTLDVLDAEQELLDSRVNLVTAQRDATVAAYNLMSAMGQLTAGKMGLNVAIYRPEDHYDDVKNKMVGF